MELHITPRFYQCPICKAYTSKPIGEKKVRRIRICRKCNKVVRMIVHERKHKTMMKSETEIREKLVKALEAQIEAVQTDDEAQFIINQARVGVLAEVLCMNVYGRDLRGRDS